MTDLKKLRQLVDTYRGYGAIAGSFDLYVITSAIDRIEKLEAENKIMREFINACKKQDQIPVEFEEVFKNHFWDILE